MTALITGLVSYLGADLLLAVLARFGFVGGRAVVASRAARQFVPLTARIIGRLVERRNRLRGNSAERREIDEEIEALGAAQKSMLEGRMR